MNTISAEILSTTKMLLVVADSRMPIESSTESASTNSAATTSYCECARSYAPSCHQAPLMTRCDVCAQSGSAIPIVLSTSCIAAENCCATGAALIPYSKISAKPMIHANSLPIVAYAYVYALPATGTIAPSSA